MEEDLRSCYVTKTKSLGDLFNRIKSAQPKRLLEKCPYCGITLPNTHDHYLPASQYPELAVHGLNLVPCCFSCNGKKGDRWKSGNERWFIHFYSDVIPSDQYLFVKLITTPMNASLGAMFAIQPPQSLAPSDWAIIQNHYKKLDLLDRYGQFANEEISAALDACVEHLSDGGKNSKKFLSRMAKRFEMIYGENHWRVVLYNALSLSQVFTNIVKTML